jgi:hypothetical protein
MMIVVQYLANSVFNTGRFVRIGDSESGAFAAAAAHRTVYRAPVVSAIGKWSDMDGSRAQVPPRPMDGEG